MARTNRTLRVRMTNELYDRLKRRAEREGVTKARLALRYIEKGLKREKGITK
jgi:predicted DNA-binding protein